MISEDTVTFDDGRVITFTDIGDPTGPAVFYNHGAPGSRLELLGLDEAFTRVGVRVITPDRPGYGGSSPLPGRSTAEWADDIAALADHVGAARFAVLGLSSGGPYAVACAALLPSRVTGAVIAAGNTDMSRPDAADGYLDHELAIMALDDADAAVAYCEEHLGHDGSHFLSGEMELGATDNAYLAIAANAAGLAATMAEAFRRGVIGYAHDIWVQGRPWSFDPSTITAPVIVVHGRDDQLVPLAHSRHTAESIPRAELRIVAGRGHLSLVEEFAVLVAEIIGPGATDRA